jgi:transposase
LYRTLDRLLKAREAIENDLKDPLGNRFQLDDDLLLYDLTSTDFEGLAQENDRARRGYCRDHRRDCQQVVLALIVTREGFPRAHLTLAGNTHDLQTVETVVTTIEARFGKSPRVWVMDRGLISKEAVKFLGRSGRRYLLATRRGELGSFAKPLRSGGWQRLQDNPEVEVKLLKRKRVHDLLARSRPRRQKERAIRRRQRRGLARALKKLQNRIEGGRLKNRDKILESVGRLKGRFPKARPFVTITVAKAEPAQLSWSWLREKFRTALAGDGVYLLRSNQDGWSATELWETDIQLTVVERAFRVLKSELLVRPVWHHYSGQTQAHVVICVLAYALWKALDHLTKRAGLETQIHKPDPHRAKVSPKPRPMTPEVILRELGQIAIGDIELETTDGKKLVLRRVARPMGEQKRILEALRLEIPERLSPDRIL